MSQDPQADGLTAEEQQEITGMFSANLTTISRASWRGIYGVITRRIDFIGSLEHTRVPLLYLYGEKSKYRAVAEMNVQRFERQNPDMEIIAFPEGIHDLHLQYPETVARILGRFQEATTNVDAVADELAARETGEGSAPRGILP